MFRGRGIGWALLAGTLLAGCDSSPATPDAAGNSGAGDYASCDTVAIGYPVPGDRTCTEWKGSALPSVVSRITELCQTSMGYTFSMTARCPTDVPGCICTTGLADLVETTYVYQTATQDPVKTAPLLCGKAVDSCFGGLTAPTTN